jgi:hypothetical protein
VCLPRPRVTQTSDCPVKQKYDDKFFIDLRGNIAKDESRDDSTRHKSDPKMIFEVGDITDGIHHPDESFDLIICKKTLDFILCGAGSAANAKSMMSECYRLLNKDHGVMMILSTAKPEDRAFFYEQDPWAGVENIKLPTNGTCIDQKKGHQRLVRHNMQFSTPIVLFLNLNIFFEISGKLIHMYTCFINRAGGTSYHAEIEPFTYGILAHIQASSQVLRNCRDTAMPSGGLSNDDNIGYQACRVGIVRAFIC